jgi:hypothetical protein
VARRRGSPKLLEEAITDEVFIVQPFSESIASCEAPLVQTTCISDKSPGVENIPPVSSSLARWEKKLRDFEEKQATKKSRVSRSEVVQVGSPVASRTRTGLKRSSSFSPEDDLHSSLNSCHDDRTSVSLRKAMAKRLSRETPQTKKGKLDTGV